MNAKELTENISIENAHTVQEKEIKETFKKKSSQSEKEAKNDIKEELE